MRHAETVLRFLGRQYLAGTPYGPVQGQGGEAGQKPQPSELQRFMERLSADPYPNDRKVDISTY
jgi:hypothetical protein